MRSVGNNEGQRRPCHTDVHVGEKCRERTDSLELFIDAISAYDWGNDNKTFRVHLECRFDSVGMLIIE